MSIARSLPGTLVAVSDLPALLAAVVAAPEDDAPRAAYAAAVAMTDAERAELISLQLRIAASRKAQRPADERGAAAMRAGELVRARGAEWARDVTPLVAKWRFVRGFVEDVVLDAAAFLARAPALYARAPVLHVQLTGAKAVAAALFGSPHLARLHSLDLMGNALGDAEVALLAASPHLANLRWLGLANNQIGRPGLDALAASRQLPRLAYVALSGNVVDDPLPGLVDEYASEKPLATELQAQHGKLAWLDFSRFREWPPERDALP